VFDTIATLYCRENDKQLTPSNVVSHDVSFPTFHMTFALATSKTSLLPPPRHSCLLLLPRFPPPRRHSCHLHDIGLATSQTSLLPRLGCGKTDIWEVARATLEVARETLRGISSDVVAMGVTLLEVARATSWRWQERRPGGGKRDVLDVARATLRGIISDMVSMGATLQDVAIATVL
jgi:hypothetical protein